MMKEEEAFCESFSTLIAIFCITPLRAFMCGCTKNLDEM